MKKLLVIFLLMPVLALAQKQPASVTYEFPLTRVVDGDTVEFQATFLPAPLKPVLSVRVYGVDTPEKGFRAQCPSEATKGEAASEFTKNANLDQLKALRKKLEELCLPQVAEDRNQLLETKNQFYNILIEGCGNEVVGLMLRQLNNRVTLLRRISLSQPGRLTETLKELEAVVVAIEKGNADKAAKLCREHVEKAAQNVLSSMSVQVAAG